ncbi:hypothetical protein DA096_19365 [Vibrio rotiferianus]|uniref:hypothetical protein n=1 Tax=Vibrio rotiferianus TaxID=190895 RepID=UPI001110AE9A|nr:hypothetical protein [Vibrio rotiferianus]TMX43690.1 hypothetical protein DA095_02560 [Vibrio rotiferianus]TMX60589.1 hypothetical protein DA093_01915 [Vibrio rotiferianus]TMX60783.1 hypothetical protein DA096_19365 [Vibrio rotiferianus]
MKEINNTCWYKMDFNCISSLLNTKLVRLLTWILVCSAFLAPHAVRAEAGPSSGQGVQPVQYNGNPTCADFYGIPDLEEFKIEPVADGVYSDGELEVAISVQEGAKTFSWDLGTSSVIIQGIFVKGGPTGNLYEYFSGGILVSSDTGLHSPVRRGDNFYGLSHISFCYTPGKPEIKITKVCTFNNIVNGDSLQYDYELKVENTGQLPLYDIKATDTTAVEEDLDNGVHMFELATLGVGDYQTFNGTFRVAQNGITNYAEVTAALAGGGEVAVSDNADWECPNQNIPGALTLQKECNVIVVNRFANTGIHEYGLEVNYNGSVCNTSEITINDVVVIDNKDSDPILIGTLTPGDCEDFSGNYEPVPGEGDGLPLAGGDVPPFADTVDAIGETVFGATVQAMTAYAECTLCPTCPEPVQCPE